MNGFSFSKLSDTVQGIIIVVLGIVLLLYTLDLLGTWVNVLFVFAALGIITYGLLKLNIISYWHKAVASAQSIKQSFNKKS